MHPSCVYFLTFQEKYRMFILLRWVLKTASAALCGLALTCTAALAQTPSAPVKLAMIEGLSGANGNAGEAVYRNLVWAVERVN
jgi:branched-chain amino acid transport system substrate-binding protein